MSADFFLSCYQFLLVISLYAGLEISLLKMSLRLLPIQSFRHAVFSFVVVDIMYVLFIHEKVLVWFVQKDLNYYETIVLSLAYFPYLFCELMDTGMERREIQRNKLYFDQAQNK